MSLINSASLIVTPNAYSEGKLYSVIPSDGSGDLSVTRATTATRVNSAGLVELVPYNLLTYSQDFNNAAWSKNNATITANNTTAPDGTMTADKVVISANTDNIIETGLPFVGVGNSNTISLYIKGSGSNIGKEVGLYIDRDGGGTYEASTVVGVLTAEWQRIEVTHTWVNSQSAVRYKISQAITTTPASEFFIWGAQLVEGSSAKDYQKTETRLNIPRLDYSNGTCPSILVEPQRTNLFNFSEQLDNAYWDKIGSITITPNNSVSPSGIQNADLATKSGGSARIQRAFTGLTAGTRTLSCFVKAGTGTVFFINTYDGIVDKGAEFNVSTGVVSFVSAGVTARIEDYGNGWYRLSHTYTSAGTSYSCQFYLDSVGTFEVWGFQFENLSSYPTSYIPTTSASVTRNADNIELLNSAILPTAYPFTMYFEAKYSSLLSFFPLSFLNSASSSNYYALFFESGKVKSTIRPNSTEIVLVSNSSYSESQTVRVAVVVESSSIKLYVNGQLEASATNTLLFNSSINDLFIGKLRSVGDTNTRLGLDSAIIWPIALTNDELERLTGTGFNTYAEMANYYNYITQ